MADPEDLESTGLLPCGVCGNLGKLSRRAWTYPSYWAECPFCGRVSFVVAVTPEEATQRWNFAQSVHAEDVRQARVEAEALRTVRPLLTETFLASLLPVLEAYMACIDDNSLDVVEWLVWCHETAQIPCPNLDDILSTLEGRE